MRNCLFALGIALVAAVFCRPAMAADIELVSMYYSASHPVPHFHYDGPVVAEDIQTLTDLVNRFAKCGAECATADGRPRAVITLNSPGGNYATGLELAQFLRNQAIATVVESTSYCYSACAFAFLGGSGYSSMPSIGAYIDRIVEPGGVVGFHAPYLDDANLEKYLDEFGGREVVDTNRASYARMVDALVYWNVDPLIVGWMLMQGPSETYDLATPNDLYLTRSALPPSPPFQWNANKKDAIRNACVRLLAAFTRKEPFIVDQAFAAGWSDDTGTTEFSEKLAGYQLGSGLLEVNSCSITHSSLATDGDYDIALYGAPGIKGSSLPIMSFFNRREGWSSMGIGANPTHRVFQKGSMNHFFLSPSADLEATAETAALSISFDKFFSLFHGDLPTTDVSLVSDAATDTTSLAHSGNVLVTMQTGSYLLFDTALVADNHPGVTLTATSESESAFYHAGFYDASGVPFSVFGFKGPKGAAVVRIEVDAENGETVTAAENALMRAVECGTSFGDLRLKCDG